VRQNRDDKRALKNVQLDLKNPDFNLLLNSLPADFREWIARNQEELFAWKPKRFLRRYLVPVYLGPTDPPRRARGKAEDEDAVYCWSISEDKKTWTLISKDKSEREVACVLKTEPASDTDASLQ
jgi:hypothetical protein